jgi:integrase
LYTTGIAEDSRSKATLFRAADGKRKALTPSPYGPHLMRQMMKRRLEDAGLPELFSPHSFRVTVVTDLLNQNIPLEDVQYLAGHSSPTTMRVYDSPSPEGHAEYRGEDFDLSLTRAQASEFVSV